jgi:hypothetical protein
MTPRQAIKKANVIMVKTAAGSSVKVSKKEATRYIRFCESKEYDCDPEWTEINNGRYLVTLS